MLGVIDADSQTRSCSVCKLPHDISKNTMIAKINPESDDKGANYRDHSSTIHYDPTCQRIKNHCPKCKEITIKACSSNSQHEYRQRCLKCDTTYSGVSVVS